MGRGRPSIREGTRLAAFIFISITRSTMRNVKVPTYLSTTGQFHGPFGK